MLDCLCVMRLALRIVAPQDQARVLADSLRAVARRARQDQACAVSEAYASLEGPGHLALEQDWRAESDLARYIRSDEFTRVLALIDMAAETPRLVIQRVGETRGLDYVAEIRDTQGAKP